MDAMPQVPLAQQNLFANPDRRCPYFFERVNAIIESYSRLTTHPPHRLCSPLPISRSAHRADVQLADVIRTGPLDLTFLRFGAF